MEPNVLMTVQLPSTVAIQNCALHSSARRICGSHCDWGPCYIGENVKGGVYSLTRIQMLMYVTDEVTQALQYKGDQLECK